MQQHSERRRGQAVGPVGRPLPAPHETDVRWPSVDWLSHYQACADGRRCRHAVRFPDWWLLMVARGIPYSSDADMALQHAAGRVNRFKGHPQLLPEPLLFTQQAVLDSLVVAPAPITESWVMGSLAAVGGMVRWVHNTGQPLTRAHVFGEETRYRWIGGAGHLTKDSASVYSARLELIAYHLNGAKTKRLPRATKAMETPVTPITLTEEADLWTWARSLRRDMRRQRVQGHIVLGLGVGLQRAEKYRVRSEHVSVDSRGVHVLVTDENGDPLRTVTCRREWEERLHEIKAGTQEGGYLMRPWSIERPTPSAIDESIRRAQKWGAPVEFNNFRLRNTWLCRHLTDGTPLKVLMAAAGMVEANHLHNLLPLLPEPSADEVAVALRGGGS